LVLTPRGFSFLDPYQVDSAEELGRCTNTEVVRNDRRLLEGVSKFLEALRLRALDHMVVSSGWTEGTYRDRFLDVELNEAQRSSMPPQKNMS